MPNLTSPSGRQVPVREGHATSVYVASSWRNPLQSMAVHFVRAAGIECYDFKDSDGFHWKEVGLTSDDCTYDQYVTSLEHPAALRGFSRDFQAMRKASHCVLVLPCGRSAHLEAGWFVGQGRPVCIWIPNGEFDEPELMYLMAQRITDNPVEVLDFLGVED